MYENVPAERGPPPHPRLRLVEIVGIVYAETVQEAVSLATTHGQDFADADVTV